MTTALQLTALLLASVSAARSVMWLTSYATSAADTALAAASALGLTAAMYLLAAQRQCSQVFAQLIERGQLTRAGVRYQRTGV